MRRVATAACIAATTCGGQIEDLNAGRISGAVHSLDETSTGTDRSPDVPAPPAEEPSICGQVDLLFVIDNSESMADEQVSLVGSFPGFIASIETTLSPMTSYHVGVISTDDNDHNAPACRQMGALTTKTADGICGPYAEGGAYMSRADDLMPAFSCAAQLGVDGSGFEKPFDAIAAALAPKGVTTLCNEGFLREPALLVVVLITDEEDENDSVGGPAQWYEGVVSSKGGDPERVVVLSLVRSDDFPCMRTDFAQPAPRIAEFTRMFPHGTLGNICSESYDAAFDATVSAIDIACNTTLD